MAHTVWVRFLKQSITLYCSMCKMSGSAQNLDSAYDFVENHETHDVEGRPTGAREIEEAFDRARA